MKLLRLLPLVALAQIIFIRPADAQEIIVDRMSTSEVAANSVQYPTLDKQLRLGLDFGFAYRLGKMAPGIDPDFGRKMRSGYSFGGDLLYFPVQAWGFGAKFNGRIFNTKTVFVEHKAEMYYFAGMGALRKFDRSNKNAWVYGVSIGYLSFKDTWTDGVSYGGVGTSLEIGYDIRVSKKQFIGLKMSVTSANIKISDMEFSNEDVQGEDTSSIEFSIGLRF